MQQIGNYSKTNYNNANSNTTNNNINSNIHNNTNNSNNNNNNNGSNWGGALVAVVGLYDKGKTFVLNSTH